MEYINLNDRTTFFASDELVQLLKEKYRGEHIINFAFTDYGGTFFDKVCIEFFTEKYPDSIVCESTAWFGKNAFLFGDIAKEFNETSENYLLGFDGIEEFYYEKENLEETKGFKFFLDSIKTDYIIKRNAMEVLSDEKGGYYSVLTSGLDYSETDLIEFCIERNIIKKRK